MNIDRPIIAETRCSIQVTVPMIARIWRGATPASKADEYLDYLVKTGIKEYRSTEGNRGVYVLRRLKDGRAEFLLMSLWESWGAIRRFAGPEMEKAVYYPEDPKFLVKLEPNVDHFEIMTGP